jgi:hypothetical protein
MDFDRFRMKLRARPPDLIRALIPAKVPLRREEPGSSWRTPVELLAWERATHISGIDLLVDGGFAAATRT